MASKLAARRTSISDNSGPLPLMEALEDRQLLSALPYTITRHHVLVIQGSRHGVSVRVTTSGRHGKFLDVTINGKKYEFRTALIRRIIFQEHSRHDRCRVPQRLPLPCEIVGYDGSDSLIGTGETIAPVDTGGTATPVDTGTTQPVDSGSGGTSSGGGNDSGPAAPAPPDSGSSDGGEGFEGTGSDFPTTDDFFGDDESLDNSSLVMARSPWLAGVFRL